MDYRYSVLMSVYSKECPEYLKASIKSILEQTIPPKEVILVCDGPLTKGLELVLAEFEKDLVLVRLKENVGLGKALAEGLLHCKYEWVARMDSDDIADQERCEKQMKYVCANPEIDVLSGTVAEFSGEALTVEEARKHILSYKKVPTTQQEIVQYIKYRNPINHPCVLFRKSKVLEAGNYQTCLYFEDYDLWVRMYLNQCVFANLSNIVLYMRVNDMYNRRGGVFYTKAIVCFWAKMYSQNIITFSQYLRAVVFRVIVSLLPNRIRKLIYDKRLRNHDHERKDK